MKATLPPGGIPDESSASQGFTIDTAARTGSPSPARRLGPSSAGQPPGGSPVHLAPPDGQLYPGRPPRCSTVRDSGTKAACREGRVDRGRQRGDACSTHTDHSSPRHLATPRATLARTLEGLRSSGRPSPAAVARAARDGRALLQPGTDARLEVRQQIELATVVAAVVDPAKRDDAVRFVAAAERARH
jgi:hypothetical protein